MWVFFGSNFGGIDFDRKGGKRVEIPIGEIGKNGEHWKRLKKMLGGQGC